MNPEENLKIYDSWQYSLSQINEFIEKLLALIGPNNVVNTDRIRNEWMWHNIAFNSGFDRDGARSADIKLDADDTDHGWLFSWVINNVWLW